LVFNVSAWCAAFTNHPDAFPQDKIIGETLIYSAVS
jgi:hypothetical protein